MSPSTHSKKTPLQHLQQLLWRIVDTAGSLVPFASLILVLWVQIYFSLVVVESRKKSGEEVIKSQVVLCISKILFHNHFKSKSVLALRVAHLTFPAVRKQQAGVSLPPQGLCLWSWNERWQLGVYRCQLKPAPEAQCLWVVHVTTWSYIAWRTWS